MRIVRYRDAGAARVGVRVPHSATAILDVERCLGIPDRDGPRVGALLASSAARETLQRELDRAVDDLDGYLERRLVVHRTDNELLAPIDGRPQLVFGSLNFRSHLEEMGVFEMPQQPGGFVKSPLSLAGPTDDIVAPPGYADMLDFEGEIGFVIGTTCHAVSPAEALACVAGVTVVNDVSARDLVASVIGAETAHDGFVQMSRNLLLKQFPTFCPMGPEVTTVDELGSLDGLDLVTRVNGTVMQQASASELVFSVGEIVSYFSAFMTLAPGDVLTTGSPAGVGVARRPPAFLHAGDVVEVEVTQVGTLRNRVLHKVSTHSV